jgi:hypothetical protein
MKFRFFAAVFCGLFLAGCTSTNSGGAARAAMNAAIRNEPPGNYFVGRRMYKQDYKVWGWVREPGRLWNSSRLVMLNEQRMLAPDRSRNAIGSDHNTEYKLFGSFSGETVYEPASDRFYPEFVLTGSEVLSLSPPDIYQVKRQNDPSVRILQPPR